MGSQDLMSMKANSDSSEEESEEGEGGMLLLANRW
jgi:hypothetical protein